MNLSIPKQPAAEESAGTLDLLMDTELPVLVRFGSTRMAMRDLMKLNTGSLIEFGCSPEHPVEIVVNGSVVARGVAVVVQGNYGVRIEEIRAVTGRASAATSVTDLAEEVLR